MSTLDFTIPGKVTGVNRIKTTVRVGKFNHTLTTASGRRDLSRVYQIAWGAAQSAGWEKPPACAVTIVAYNSRLDCDGACKVVLDGMIGAVYDDDRIVTELRVEKRKDLGGERYDVTVEPRAALVAPKKPSKRKAAA